MFTDSLQSNIINALERYGEAQTTYILFGKFLAPTREKIILSATILKTQQEPFIWSVQDLSVLPPKFEEEVKGFGVIVEWVDQIALLCHPDMGWNTVLETCTMGIPMLAWPIDHDQVHNAHLVTEISGSGITFPDNVVGLSNNKVLDHTSFKDALHDTFNLALHAPAGNQARVCAQQIGADLQGSIQDSNKARTPIDSLIDHIHYGSRTESKLNTKL
ncbi:hypothetical protein BT96DRAFT_978857 [Gymnopus androsaceus JB14]|uniref:UDP-Glycosyltransferase/glycogen phosphorylase n=1 Tax=Gymnopus androsaceus JB14 TaxID=1447944 RepID=A0A6A4H644_9AGAR|nr:hypothetical protein BT96DRAFT_978857 [Gymnopus androsaceus JB14]